MIEVSDIRKRLKARLDQIKREAVERRARNDAAARAYETFLAEVATPVFQMFASVVKAEGYPFSVFTPAGGLRLMSERSADDFIELFLDTSGNLPVVSARINRGRGRRIVNYERAVREDTPVEKLTDEDVVSFLVDEVGGFVER